MLELYGTLLLAKLEAIEKDALTLKIPHITYWTDSTAVLGWLGTVIYKLNTYGKQGFITRNVM